MFDEHVFVFVPSKIEISYKVKNPDPSNEIRERNTVIGF